MPLPLPRSYIHVYDHHFQRSFSLKPLGQSKPSCMRSLLGKEQTKYTYRFRSHDQDGRHARIWLKPSKIFSYRTNSPMIMKLGMEHYKLKLYKLYINDAPELTFTYFTTMSILEKLVFVLYSRPRYQDHWSSG